MKKLKPGLYLCRFNERKYPEFYQKLIWGAWIITWVQMNPTSTIKWESTTLLYNKETYLAHQFALLKWTQSNGSSHSSKQKLLFRLTCKTVPVEFCSAFSKVTVITVLSFFVFFSSQAISFLTPLAVIFVVKIIQRTDKTEIKEACLGTWRQFHFIVCLLQSCCDFLDLYYLWSFRSFTWKHELIGHIQVLYSA